jgi:hypothetical protein
MSKLLNALLCVVLAAVLVPAHAAEPSRQEKKTLSDLRSIASALETYAIDDFVYPDAATLDELAAKLAPKFIPSLPRVDGWGNEYVYVSDTATYRMVSAGPDGTFAKDSRRLGVAKGDFGDDVILENSEFLEADGTRSP